MCTKPYAYHSEKILGLYYEVAQEIQRGKGGGEEEGTGAGVGVLEHRLLLTGVVLPKEFKFLILYFRPPKVTSTSYFISS